MNEAQHELLGAYAVDALEGAERDAFEAHLADCASCRDELAGLRETLAEFGSGFEQQPPSGLRAAVLDAVAGRPRGAGRAGHEPERRRRRGSRTAMPRPRRRSTSPPDTVDPAPPAHRTAERDHPTAHPRRPPGIPLGDAGGCGDRHPGADRRHGVAAVEPPAHHRSRPRTSCRRRTPSGPPSRCRAAGRSPSSARTPWGEAVLITEAMPPRPAARCIRPGCSGPAERWCRRACCRKRRPDHPARGRRPRHHRRRGQSRTARRLPGNPSKRVVALVELLRRPRLAR